MSPAIYTLATTPRPHQAQLVDISGKEIPADWWQQLAGHITQEESLKHYPAGVLRNRWLENRAAIVVDDVQIVSYISVVSVYVDESRQKLAAMLGLPANRLPRANVYESATGWTHPQWRRKGISFQLRRCLLAQFEQGSRLYISVAAGLAASPVLARLNWRLVAWDSIPFVSNLIGVSRGGLRQPVTVKGRFLPESMALYRGQHLDPDTDSTHPWENYCHFWVSDEVLAVKMDRELATLLKGDLLRWKEAVISVLFTAPPERTWRPFLFEDEG